MRHRPGVTLIEVLVAMFIMAIGMLALLTLFPLGAVRMGQALRDDRATSAGIVAANQAIALDIWHDPLIVGTTPATPANRGLDNLFINPGDIRYALGTKYVGTSHPVYVDPFGVQEGLGPVGTTPPHIPRGGLIDTSPGIPRVTLSFLQGATAGQTDRYFTFLDDLSFANNGLPDRTAVGPGRVERAGRFTWAYLLRRRSAWEDNHVQMFVVVYNGRNIGGLTQEPLITFGQTGPGDNIAIPASVEVRRGAWILDVTCEGGPGWIGKGGNDKSSSGSSPPLATKEGSERGYTEHHIRGDFYQVIDTDSTPRGTTVHVQPSPTLAWMTHVVVMNDVCAVFEREVSWEP